MVMASTRTATDDGISARLEIFMKTGCQAHSNKHCSSREQSEHRTLDMKDRGVFMPSPFTKRYRPVLKPLVIDVAMFSCSPRRFQDITAVIVSDGVS